VFFELAQPDDAVTLKVVGLGHRRGFLRETRFGGAAFIAVFNVCHFQSKFL